MDPTSLIIGIVIGAVLVSAAVAVLELCEGSRMDRTLGLRK